MATSASVLRRKKQHRAVPKGGKKKTARTCSVGGRSTKSNLPRVAEEEDVHGRR
jgi:hypothetical protein